MRILSTALAATLSGGFVIATATAPASPASVEPTASSMSGVLYAGRQGAGTVRMVQIGKEEGRPLLLIDVEVECDGFTPEGRGVAMVEEGGRFEVELGATDTGTTDVVTGEFDDIDGRVRPDAAVLEIDVDVEGEDNAGPTGRCEDTQQWRLTGRPNVGAERIEAATPVDADEVATGPSGVFTLARGDAGASVRAFDPDSLEPRWQADSTEDATVIATAGGAVWVLDEASRFVTRLDVATGDHLATLGLDEVPADGAGPVFTPMVATDAALWVGFDDTEQLFRVDAITDGVQQLPMPGGVRALAPAGDGGVYAAVASADRAARSGRLVHLDAGGAELASVEQPAAPDALAAGGGVLWVGDGDVLVQHDPITLAPIGGPFDVPRAASSPLVAVAPGIWLSTGRGLLGLDPAAERLVAVPVVGAGGVPLAAGRDGALWVLDSGYLVRIAA